MERNVQECCYCLCWHFTFSYYFTRTHQFVLLCKIVPHCLLFGQYRYFSLLSYCSFYLSFSKDKHLSGWTTLGNAYNSRDQLVHEWNSSTNETLQCWVESYKFNNLGTDLSTGKWMTLNWVHTGLTPKIGEDRICMMWLQCPETDHPPHPQQEHWASVCGRLHWLPGSISTRNRLDF